MPTLGDMLVRILGDNVQFDGAIDKSSAKYDNFAKKVERGGKTLTKFVTLPLLAAAGAAVKFAIDAEETAAKFGTAFRKVRKEADRTAKDLAKNYGLSNQESQQLLASTGDLLKGFGATGAEALGLSDKVQRLAVDLASYNNVQGGGARASQIITRAMLGEREALTTLGIKISEAAVLEKLRADGLEDLEGKALLLAKAEATLQLVTEQSGDAMGDFARTSDSAANQLRIMRARVVDAATSFGEEMVPTVNRIVGRVTDLVGAFAALDSGTKQFLITVGFVAAVAGPALLVFGKLVTTFRILKTAIASATIALKAMDAATKTTIAGLALAGIGLLVGGIVSLTGKVRAARAAQEEFNESLKDTAESAEDLDETLRKTETGRNILIGLVKDEIAGYKESIAMMRGYELKTEDTWKEIDRLTAALENAEGRLASFNKLQDETLTPDQKRVEEARLAINEGLARTAQEAHLAAVAGREFNLVEERRKVLLTELKKLIGDDFTFETPLAKGGGIQTLLAEFSHLLDDYDAQIAALVDIEEKERRVAEAQKEREEITRRLAEFEEERAEIRKQFYDERLAEEGNEIARIEELKRVYLAAGVHENDVDKWVISEKEKLRQASHDDEIARQLSLASQITSIVANMVSGLKGISAAYYESQRLAIENNVDDEEQRDKKIRALKRKEAIDNKLFAIFDIALKTAQAIIGYLANPGGTAGIGLSIAAGIIGAIQAGIVAAQPLPSLAQGGVALPTPGGTAVRVAEAGVAEAILPLDKLGSVLSSLPVPEIDAGGDIHLQVMMDSEPILKKIFPATRNRTVLIDARAVTP